MNNISGVFQGLRGLLVGGPTQVDPVDGHDLVAPPDLAGEVGGASAEDKRDENSFAVLAADDVEAEAGRALLEADLSGHVEFLF